MIGQVPTINNRALVLQRESDILVSNTIAQYMEFDLNNRFRNANRFGIFPILYLFFFVITHAVRPRYFEHLGETKNRSK